MVAMTKAEFVEALTGGERYLVSNGKAVSCWSKKKRRTGGETVEEEVEKVEEHRLIGDGGAGLVSWQEVVKW